MSREYPAADRRGGRRGLARRPGPPGPARQAAARGPLEPARRAQQLGETVAEAARREVKEEVGLEVTLGDIVATIDLIERDEDDRIRYHYTLIDFVAEAPSAALRPGSDAADARWFSVAEIELLGLWSETVRVIKLAARAAAVSLRPVHASAWDLTPAEARALQERLSGEAEWRDRVGAPDLIAGIDVGFEDRGRVTRAAVGGPEIRGSAGGRVRAGAPADRISVRAGAAVVSRDPAVLEALAALAMHPGPAAGRWPRPRPPRALRPRLPPGLAARHADHWRCQIAGCWASSRCPRIGAAPGHRCSTKAIWSAPPCARGAGSSRCSSPRSTASTWRPRCA